MFRRQDRCFLDIKAHVVKKQNSLLRLLESQISYFDVTVHLVIYKVRL